MHAALLFSSFRKNGALLLSVVVVSILLSACGTSAQPACSYAISESLSPYLAPFEAFDRMYAISAARINGAGQLELVTPYFTAQFDQTQRSLSLKPVNDVLQLSPLPDYLRIATAEDAVFGDLNTIYGLFAGAVSQLGSELVGLPMVEGLLYNDMANRFEMYYANLGFYMAADGKIHLLHYGAWANAGDLRCASVPDYGVPPRSLSALDADTLISERMKALEQNIPGSFIGFALGRMAYLDPTSGMYLKPYRGGVVALNPADPDEIGLVKTYLALGFAKTELEPPLNEPGTMFYMIVDGLGYNIREDIYNWVSLHSGQDLAGKPVMSTYHHSAGDINCFEAYCVIIYPDGRIEALDLGERYIKAYPPPEPLPAPTSESSPSPTTAPNPVPTITAIVLDRVTVRPWDTSAGLIYGHPLYVHAGVFSGNRPVKNAPLYLILYMPDSTTAGYQFPLTDELGMTSVLLENFTANNGDIVEYEVCLDMPDSTDVCSPWFFTFRQGP